MAPLGPPGASAFAPLLRAERTSAQELHCSDFTRHGLMLPVECRAYRVYCGHAREDDQYRLGDSMLLVVRGDHDGDKRAYGGDHRRNRLQIIEQHGICPKRET